MCSLTSIKVAVTKKMTEIDYRKRFHEKLEEFMNKYSNGKSRKDGITGVNRVNFHKRDCFSGDCHASLFY